MQVQQSSKVEAAVGPGESITTPPGTWVRYETPEATEYVAVCTPAFSPDLVHRDAE
jgi:hypothetical protein